MGRDPTSLQGRNPISDVVIWSNLLGAEESQPSDYQKRQQDCGCGPVEDFESPRY